MQKQISRPNGFALLLVLLTIALAAAIAALFLGERLSALALCGAAVVLAATVLIARYDTPV